MPTDRNPEDWTGGGYPHPNGCTCSERHRNLIRHPSETPLLCVVCGCTWEEQKAPDEVCPDFHCPCHQSFWLWLESLDENEKRAMWGDR